jgi:hypothetical protein
MFFEIVGNISDVEIIAIGKGIRESRRLRKAYAGRMPQSNSRMVRFVQLSFTGMKPAESDQESSRPSGFWKRYETHGKELRSLHQQ